MVILCCGLIAVSGLSFADDKQVAGPPETPLQLAHDKVIFDHDQAIYNDTANKNIRANKLAQKKIKSNERANKKVQKLHDANGGLNEKNEQDVKNEQYDKRLVVKF